MTIEQIDELMERLTELIDFAEANIWEVPIDMPDALDLAIMGLKELKQWNKLLNTEEGYPVTAEELREVEKRNEARIKAFKEMMKER